MAPAWEELANEVYPKGIKVGSVDCTSNRDVCDRIDVGGYPTLFVLEGNQAYQFKNQRNLENLIAFVSDKNYRTYGEKAEIVKDEDVPKSSFGKIYKEISKGLEFIFDNIGLGAIPHYGQLAIAAFVCSLPFLLIIYALCYPDEEYEKYQEIYEKQKNDAEKEKLAKKDK
mmetsp:Transcript_19326/g.17140  ORF Transcript_19326/g.17140 Transcript_19326/m.17140 type:complete len:170 (+) Transcript_19326:217-726(+)|eukprot:CAMPEP_0205806796 /NCGR_PEP_ID=MMETSP0205-20121125/10427_1 /ASSEMBLY_ACC=CAM_ASM_000278 /TAXON_ID=36767 /ORGANISM="Euplotes focardii, Strain TN1" /LENGTH=169 /DNA_ID=CAMNT_0053080187 /DNA_START=194 /DNA_END=703 /DNA_ORIENTATION=+